MKAELVINNVRLELGHKELNEISYVLNDCKRNRDIFHELAKSQSTETRARIASQTHLYEKTAKLLLADNQIDVIRSMMNRGGRTVSHLGKTDIEKLINIGDHEVLNEIINRISDLTETFEVCEKDWLCEKLYQQPDPSVRFELASSEDTSEFILKKLLEDSDINVSQAAKDTLRKIEFNGDE